MCCGETLGPAHDRTFTIAVMVGSKRYRSAAGRSKKRTEQQAAGLAVAQPKEEEEMSACRYVKRDAALPEDTGLGSRPAGMRAFKSKACKGGLGAA